MAKMIQLRNVPDDLHRKLKIRAAKEGLSLSDYLIRDARRLAEQPTLDEWFEKLRTMKPIRTRESSADAVRTVRREAR